MAKKTKRKAKAKAAKAKRGRQPGSPNKSDFIRSQPKDMPAAAVVEAGAKKGLKFSQQLVYNVRAGARKTNGGASKRGRPRKAARLSDGVDAQFRQLVVDLGVARSRELIEEVDSAVRRAVAGG